MLVLLRDCWIKKKRPLGDAGSFRCVWPVREELLEGGERCPAVLSREFRWTDHVRSTKQETFLSGV